jgi:hypothetical protein
LIGRQLEAIAAAAQDTTCEVWVMAPMIATVDEAETFVELAHGAAGRSPRCVLHSPRPRAPGAKSWSISHSPNAIPPQLARPWRTP